jgi:hypothetical protein
MELNMPQALEAIFNKLNTPVRCFRLKSASLLPKIGPLLSSDEGRPYLSGPGYSF